MEKRITRENRIRLTQVYFDDYVCWRPMCAIVNNRFFQERSLTFKAIYSNRNKLKGFEVRRAGSRSVIGYIDARDYMLYFINRKKVNSQVINLSSPFYTTEETTVVRYVGNGMFEYGGVIR